MNPLDWAADARRFFRGFESDRASGVVRETVAAALHDPGLEGFRSEMAGRVRAPLAVVQGTTAEGLPFVMRPEQVREHAIVSGKSGDGKTYSTMCSVTPTLAARLARPRSGGVIFLDGKGEVTELVQRVVTECLAAMPPHERHQAMRRVRKIDPFNESFVPPLNMLVPPEGVEPEIYRGLFMSSLADTTAPPGIRQRMDTRWRLRIVEEHGLVAPVGLRAMRDPRILEALVRRSSEEVRTYYASRRDDDVVRGVDARLDEFFALRSTRRAFAAQTAFDFRDALDEGVTIVNLGNAPYGSQGVQRFWGRILLARLVAAIFARSNDPSQPPALLLADEIQELLLPEIAEDFGRILALARARQVALWATVQEIGQLSSASPLLARVFLTNASTWTTFSVAEHDQHFVRTMLRPTGRRIRPPGLPWEPARGGYFLRPEEELQALVDEAVSLPPRVAYVWDRRSSRGAVRIRTADVTIPEADDLPNALFAEVCRGSVAVSAAEVDALLACEEARLEALGRSPEEETAAVRPHGTTAHRGRRRLGSNVPLPNLG